VQNTLVFGTAGIPRSALKQDTISGLERIKELGLDAMELEFVRGVHLTPSAALAIAQAKTRLGLRLTCHAPYFINLASVEPAKVKASIKRILDSARISSLCGAESVTFHAGFYMQLPPETVYQTIKQNITQIIEILRKEKIAITLKPELTGKPTQFGSLEELTQLASEINDLGICIDFSHLHARNNGKYNSYAELSQALKKVKQQLGEAGLSNLHIHTSGIEYTAKGERKHLNLKESDMNYRDLIKALKDNNAGGILICESPNLEEDALLLQKEYRKK
jgi:deoxyribonuclease IV